MAGDTSRTNGRLGGRPRGSENDQTVSRREMRKRWLDRVYAQADLIFDAQLDLALGYFTEEAAPNGKKRVYQRPPNGKSLQWIMEQAWGKAPQNLNLEVEDQEVPLNTEEEARLKRSIEFAMGFARPRASSPTSQAEIT